MEKDAPTMMNEPEKWPVIKDRISYIRQLSTGLDVLDVGCTGRKANGRIPHAGTTLHQAIKPVCKSLVGVDVDADGTRLMEQNGFTVLCDDITSMDLKHTFDIIVAGEVIEHLLNPGLALQNLGKHLRHNGKLLVTTCNPFYYRQQSKILRHGFIQVHREHVAWYDPLTISVMLDDSGFRIIKGVWLSSQKRWNIMTLLAYWRRYWNPNFLVEATLRE
jgi:2-polyprenyl-3-methyl-5-hydroxy-6-metoxy-1,4-benzoquinol methylase